MSDTIIMQALAATTIVKVVVDMIRHAHPIPGLLVPLLALGIGIVTALLLVIADGHAITLALGAQSVLAGVLAAGSAVGVTELQKRVS